MQLCDATWGLFLQDGVDESGGSYALNRVPGSGNPLDTPGTLSELPLLAELLRQGDTMCSADTGAGQRSHASQVNQASRISPFGDTPGGQPRARSLLAAAVRGRGGKLGALIYGHPDTHFFGPGAEFLLSTLASQAAGAMNNAHLALSLEQKALSLKQKALSLEGEIAVSEAARERQRTTAERLRQAMESAGLGTWSWDRASDQLDLDDRCAELFHLAPGTPVLRSELRDHLVPEDREHARDHLRKALATDGTYNAEYRLTHDKLTTWISTHGLATHAGAPGSSSDASGAITGMIGVAQDITARKLQEESLRVSEKLAATGRLAATVAHEINNPLEAVTNLIYLVKTDAALPPHLQQLLETADSELSSVAQIAQQTLGFYRDTTRPTEIDLNGLLSAVVSLFARKLTYKRLRCTLDIEPGLRLFGLTGEMRQVFSNLLVNAIDASQTGTIHLRARHRSFKGKPGIVVLLSDPGSGIPHHARTRLFSPFFTTKESVGTGLGLWVTRGMIEKHGGKIHFRSRTEHPTGTVFRVHLPKGSVGSKIYSSASPGLVH